MLYMSIASIEILQALRCAELPKKRVLSCSACDWTEDLEGPIKVYTEQDIKDALISVEQRFKAHKQNCPNRERAQLIIN